MSRMVRLASTRKFLVMLALPSISKPVERTSPICEEMKGGLGSLTTTFCLVIWNTEAVISASMKPGSYLTPASYW